MHTFWEPTFNSSASIVPKNPSAIKERTYLHRIARLQTAARLYRLFANNILTPNDDGGRCITEFRETSAACIGCTVRCSPLHENRRPSRSFCTEPWPSSNIIIGAADETRAFCFFLFNVARIDVEVQLSRYAFVESSDCSDKRGALVDWLYVGRVWWEFSVDFLVFWRFGRTCWESWISRCIRYFLGRIIFLIKSLPPLHFRSI